MVNKEGTKLGGDIKNAKFDGEVIRGDHNTVVLSFCWVLVVRSQ